MKISALKTYNIINRIPKEKTPSTSKKETNNQVFSLFSYPKNYYFFTGSNIPLKSIENLHCAYCGKIMLTTKDLEDISKMNGEQFAQTLSKIINENNNLYSPQHIKAIKYVQKIAYQNREMSVSELVDEIEYRIYKTVKNSVKKNQNIRQQIKEILDTINDPKLKELIDKDKILYPEKAANGVQIKNSNRTNTKMQINILKKIEELRKKHPDCNSKRQRLLWNKLIALIKTINSKNSGTTEVILDKIIKGAKKAPKEEKEFIFTKMLFANSKCSVEHIKPHSELGCSNSSNYLVAHAVCNSKRGALPLWQFLETKPQAKNAILKYFNDLNVENSSMYTKEEANEYIKDAIDSIIQELKPDSSLKTQEFVEQLKTLSQEI